MIFQEIMGEVRSILSQDRTCVCQVINSPNECNGYACAQSWDMVQSLTVFNCLEV